MSNYEKYILAKSDLKRVLVSVIIGVTLGTALGYIISTGDYVWGEGWVFGSFKDTNLIIAIIFSGAVASIIFMFEHLVPRFTSGILAIPEFFIRMIIFGGIGCYVLPIMTVVRIVQVVKYKPGKVNNAAVV